MKNFILMVQFLTRIPIKKEIDVKEDSFIKGVAYYPLVGVIIGGYNLLIYGFLNLVFHGETMMLFKMMMVVLANTMITGGFHLDGLADTCDAIYSARPREQMLEIMKDSRLGTNGALALIFDLGLRVILLSGTGSIVLAILLPPIGAKTVVGFLIAISKYAREKGLAGLYLGRPEKLPSVVCVMIGTILYGVFFQFTGLFLMCGLLFVGYLLKIYMDKILGGMTGDTFGGVNEVIEIVALIAIVALTM